MNSMKVDQFKYAKEMGKHICLGSHKVLSYIELSERIKKNIELLKKLKKK